MNYYDSISEGYDELHGQEQMQKANIIAGELLIRSTNKILDIGAGTGIYDSLFNNCREKVNLDPSEELLKKNNNSKSTQVVGTAEALPFPDRSFDIIISLSALHHVKDIKKAISEIKRVARPKAQFALTILKKAANSNDWIAKIKEEFNVMKEIDEEKDIILICK